MYEDLWKWAYAVGMAIKNKDERLLRSLIFDIRGEETPGRFLSKLINTLSCYKTNRNINIDINIHPSLITEEWHGDRFYYMKAAILVGFTNALSKGVGEEKERGEGNE